MKPLQENPNPLLSRESIAQDAKVHATSQNMAILRHLRLHLLHVLPLLASLLALEVMEGSHGARDTLPTLRDAQISTRHFHILPLLG